MSKEALIFIRVSETANHLPLQPGTDALLTRAMISIILQEGWQNTAYLENGGNPLSGDYGHMSSQCGTRGDFK